MASRISATRVMLIMTAALMPPSASSVTYSSTLPRLAAVTGTLLGLGSRISSRIRVDMRVNEGVFHDNFASPTCRNGANLRLWVHTARDMPLGTYRC